MLAWCSQRNLKLFFHGYGGCIPGLAPTEAECHKRAQTVHWANTAPNYATREPSVCTGCFLFMVGPESVEFWRDRYVSNSTAYLQAKAEGKAEGMRLLLQQLLEHKFDRVPSWAQKRLENASPAQIERWAKRAISAQTLEQVIGKR